MSPTPSTKPPFQAIKDHSDLMESLECLIVAIIQRETCCDSNVSEEIKYFKSEIAHFLRIQSAQPGVAVEGCEDVFHQSGASADHNVKKISQVKEHAAISELEEELKSMSQKTGKEQLDAFRAIIKKERNF